MTRPWMRSALAILAALVVAMVLIVAVEGIGAVLHPFPDEADTSDPEVVAAHVAECPHWFLAIVAVLWGGMAFASAWVATRLGAGRHPAHGIVIGALLLLGVGLNMFLLPYPLWFELANVVTFPLATFLAIRCGRAPSV